MTHWIYIELTVLAFVIAITGIFIPQILRIAFRKNLFDKPSQRKIHTSKVPRLGGLAFLPAIILGLAALLVIGAASDDTTVLRRIYLDAWPLCFVGCAAIVLYATGILDDLIGVKYRAKFVMQTMAAVLVIAGGLRIDNLYGFCGLYELSDTASILLTVLFLVTMINAINLIDGVDGLASGLGIVACSFYSVIFYISGLYVFSVVAAVTLGTLLPFFFFNVFGTTAKHTKIFMGDTGALVIGLLLGVLSIGCFQINPTEIPANPAVIAISPLLIPGFDLVRVYIHRLKCGRNPFLPDKTHVHHKLLALGLSQRNVMLALVSLSIIFIVTNYFLSIIINISLLFFCDLAFWIFANALLTRAIRRRERRTGSKVYF